MKKPGTRCEIHWGRLRLSLRALIDNHLMPNKRSYTDLRIQRGLGRQDYALCRTANPRLPETAKITVLLQQRVASRNLTTAYKMQIDGAVRFPYTHRLVFGFLIAAVPNICPLVRLFVDHNVELILSSSNCHTHHLPTTNGSPWQSKTYSGGRQGGHCAFGTAVIKKHKSVCGGEPNCSDLHLAVTTRLTDGR